MITHDRLTGIFGDQQSVPASTTQPWGEYMPESDDAASITYSVKELLGEIRGSLGRLEGKLDAKADRSEVHEMIRRLDQAENRITALESHVTTQKAVHSENREWHRFIWPTLISMILVALGLLAWLYPMK